MLKPEQVPDKVWMAARLELVDGPIREDMEDRYRHAIAAALNAWPGMSEENRNGFSFTPLPHGTAFRYTALILPLTENPDE